MFRLQFQKKSSVLVDLGRIYEKDNDVEKALATYREAVGVDGQNAAAHLRKGILLGRRKDKSYETELDRAFQLYQTLSNPEGQAEVLYQRGLLLSSVDLPHATAILEKARQMANAISSEQQEVAATLQLSTVAYLSGDLKGGEMLAIDGVERARRAGMNYMAARGLADLSGTQFLRRDYTRSEASYQESLDLSRRFGMRRTEARALAGLANLHQTLRQEDKAIEEAAAALAYYRESGFQVEALQTLLLLARAHRSLGHGKEAIADFEQALTAAKQLSDPSRVLLAEQGLATVFQNYGRLPEAVSEHERARQSAAALKDQDDVVRALVGQGTVLSRLGRYQEAEKTIAQAEQAVENAPGKASLSVAVLNAKAGLALDRGDRLQAIAMLRRIFDDQTASGQLRQSARCAAALGMARTGQAASGRSLCEPALQALEETDDRLAILEARMCLTEILYLVHDMTTAVDQATKAAEAAATVQAPEIEWRAWALRAQALRRRDDESARQAAQHASQLLGSLGWDTENLRSYTARPDIQALQHAIQESSK